MLVDLKTFSTDEMNQLLDGINRFIKASGEAMTESGIFGMTMIPEIIMPVGEDYYLLKLHLVFSADNSDYMLDIKECHLSNEKEFRDCRL